ncbi:MAG: SpoIIIAH-like family protein, partial [Butyrivibrio sp.]|nr:SpoIIIAH-like family protein [Butyrivibrio sp.]
MKKIFKKNQIIITALALMIAVAGYINYSDNIKNKNKNKENAVQSGTNLEGETDPVSGEIQSNDAEPNSPYDDPGSMVFTSNVTSQFIISAKLEREQVRASGKETLLEVINSSEVSEDMKAEAVSGMVALADAAEKEAAAELLLEAKGFQNVIVSVNGNQVDVVVESNDLNATQLAQI